MVKIIILGNSWWILTPFLEVIFNFWRNKKTSPMTLSTRSLRIRGLWMSYSTFGPKVIFTCTGKSVTPMMVCVNHHKMVTNTTTPARSGQTLRTKKLALGLKNPNPGSNRAPYTWRWRNQLKRVKKRLRKRPTLNTSAPHSDFVTLCVQLSSFPRCFWIFSKHSRKKVINSKKSGQNEEKEV